jgi:transcription elongation factor GreB
MGIRETFLQQTSGLLISNLNARKTALEADLLVARERRQDARADGDLSENSAYHEAGNTEEGIHAELASITKRLSELDTFLSASYIYSGFISEGSAVKLLYQSGRERMIMIVPDQFAEREHGWIAAGSPIGQELEGKKAGDSVTVTMPQKAPVYKIMEVD